MTKDELKKQIEEHREEIERLTKEMGDLMKKECPFQPGEVVQVWDNIPHPVKHDTFLAYDPDLTHPFACTDESWKNAKRLNPLWIPAPDGIIPEVEGNVVVKHSDNRFQTGTYETFRNKKAGYHVAITHYMFLDDQPAIN